MVAGAAEDARSAGPRETVSRADVLDVALTLFADRGYHGTALSEIAAKLGIRTPSLYNHMRSKQDLLSEIVGETTEQVWADYLGAVDGVNDVAERLRRAVRVYALRHATRRREALVVNQDAGHLEEPVRLRVFELRRRHENAIRGLIEEGVASGRFREPTPSLASFGILEMCVSIARWFHADGPLSAEAVADRYSEYALHIVGLASTS